MTFCVTLLPSETKDTFVNYFSQKELLQDGVSWEIIYGYTVFELHRFPPTHSRIINQNTISLCVVFIRMEFTQLCSGCSETVG